MQQSNPILTALALAITKARVNTDMKQATAAKALGIARSTLSGYENGNLKDLTVVTLLAICVLYHQPLSYFLICHPGQVANSSSQENLALPHSAFVEGSPKHTEQLKMALAFLLSNLR